MSFINGSLKLIKTNIKLRLRINDSKINSKQRSNVKKFVERKKIIDKCDKSETTSKYKGYSLNV